MGSSRLPKKVLMKLGRKTTLEYMIERVKKSKLIEKVVVATTNDPKDDQIFDLCRKKKINCFRGSENDVLDRYYQTSKKYNASIVVRLTSDCPLIDPNLIDLTIKLYINNNVDYASNTVPPENKKFPDGTDVEVFSFQLLEKAWIEATNPNDREHVTFFFWKNNNGFKTILLDNNEDWGKYRITIDYPEDLELVREIILKLSEKNKYGYVHEIVDILKNYPELVKINSMHSWGANW